MAFANLIDGTSTVVSSNTPGRWLDLRRFKTRARSGVPVRLWVKVLLATAGDTGAVVLVDENGATMLTVVVSNGPGWYIADGVLPATRAKYDLHAGGNTANSLAIKNWSLYPIADVGPNAGALAKSIGSIVASATGEVFHEGQLAQSIGSVTLSAVASLEITGSATPTLGAVTSSATGTVANPTPLYAGQASGGTTDGSAATATFTPTAGDLILAFVVSIWDETSESVTDNNSNQNGGGTGTYTQIGTTNDGSGRTLLAYVRNDFCGATSSTTVTANIANNSAQVLIVIRVSGMRRAGTSAILQSSFDDSGVASTPATTFASNCNTASVTIVAVTSGDTTTTPPTNWTERADANQSTPTTALEAATRDSGFTGTTVTWGAAQSTAWCAVGIELNGSAP